MVVSPVAAAPLEARTPAGQLYRSAGASGALAALARPARSESARPHAESAPAPAPAQVWSPDLGDGGKPVAAVPVVSVTGWGQPAIQVISSADPVVDPVVEPAAAGPAWLNPAAPDEDDRPSRAPGLLGRPTFVGGGARVSDGLLLATDGLTWAGELALVGAASLLGALIDLVLGMGAFLPLLTLLAAWFGAFRIRQREMAMAFAIPPIAYLGMGFVIGQLSLPAGRHVLTREALLIVNLLPGAFPWLLVLLAGVGAIFWLRGRAART